MCESTFDESAIDIAAGVDSLFETDGQLIDMKDQILAFVNSKGASTLYMNVKGYEQAQALMESFSMQLHKLQGATLVDGMAANLAKVVDALGKLDHPDGMTKVGRVVGNLTGLQALHRPLKVGETRATLASRCMKAIFKHKLLSMDPKLVLTLKALEVAGPQGAQNSGGSSSSGSASQSG